MALLTASPGVSHADDHSIYRPLLSPSAQTFRFPGVSVSYLHYRKTKKRYRLIRGVKHLNKWVGSKPLVLLYFSPDEDASVTELKALSKLALSFKGKVACFGVVRVYNRGMLYQLIRKLKKWNVTIPILLDWRGVLAYATLSQKTPSYAAVDKFGNLKLARASSLNEWVAPKTTTLQCLQTLYKTGTLSRVRAPGYNPNPYHHLGKTGKKSSLLSVTSKKKLKLGPTMRKRPLVLVFWSPACKHCRKLLPKLQSLDQANNTKATIATVAYAPSPDQQKKLRVFLRKNKLELPVYRADRAVLARFHIRSFPTYLLLGTDGTMRAVHFGATPAPSKVIPHMLKSLR